MQLCIFVLSLNNRHHFLTLPSLIAPSLYTTTICLWISARQTFLAFKNHTSNRPSRVVGMFSSSLTTTTNGGNTFDTVLCNTRYHSHTADDWPPQEVCASPAWLLCAIGSYFLDAPHTLKKCKWFGIKKIYKLCHCEKHTYNMSISADRKCMTCMISSLCHIANEMCFSGIVCSVEWYSCTDVSVQPVSSSRVRQSFFSIHEQHFCISKDTLQFTV